MYFTLPRIFCAMYWVEWGCVGQQAYVHVGAEIVEVLALLEVVRLQRPVFDTVHRGLCAQLGGRY